MAQGTAGVPAREWKASRIALLAAVAVALIAIVYAVSRRDAGPSVPPPVAPTAAAAQQAPDPEATIRALQEQVGANPKDAGAWKQLGQAYFVLNRYADAARAYRRATAISPNDPVLWSAYGEAAVMASERDPMPPDALAAFGNAHRLDPKDARARYFLGVARDLKGEHQGAIDDWIALLADTPAGAPWEPDLRRTIEQVGKIHKIDVSARLAAVKPASGPAPAAMAPASGGGMAGFGPAGGDDPVAVGGIPGPSREQMQAASSLPKGAQDQMVQGMVDGLEAKLKAAPANVDGWIMLMRSRMTLGETARAAAARDAAIRSNPAATARIRAAASTLGVPGS